MTTILIRGSHGSLSVHAATGHIVDRDLGDDDYLSIAFFDPVSLASRDGHIDILAAGYWTLDGDCAEPLTMRLAESRSEMVFDDWVPMRLLPAPGAGDLPSRTNWPGARGRATIPWPSARSAMPSSRSATRSTARWIAEAPPAG